MRLALLLALSLVPTALSAGLRATYEDPSGQKLLIETDDAGGARITGPDPNQYGVLRAGQFYVVAKEGTRWSVARIEDVAAALDRVGPPIFKDIFRAGAAAAGKKRAVRIEPKGKSSLLGREGEKYSVFYPASETPDDPTEMLISTDPQLQPVGKALEAFTVATTVLMSGFIGPSAVEDIKDTQTIFALGTPLLIEGSYRLTAVDKADIPHERTELPAKPETLQEVISHTKVRALTPEEMEKRN